MVFKLCYKNKNLLSDFMEGWCFTRPIYVDIFVDD